MNETHEKAMQIAKKHCITFGWGLNQDDSIQCYNSAVEMGEWLRKKSIYAFCASQCAEFPILRRCLIGGCPEYKKFKQMLDKL